MPLRAARTSPRGSTIPPSPILRMCAGCSKPARRRSSTRGRPTASAARRRSRGRACAPATCPAASTCPSPTLTENGRLKDRRRSRTLFERAGIDPTSGRHKLRLRRLGRDPDARPRSHRPSREGALRRLMGGMGSAGGCPASATGPANGRETLIGTHRHRSRKLKPRPMGRGCNRLTCREVSAGSGSGTASCARAAGS